MPRLPSAVSPHASAALSQCIACGWPLDQRVKVYLIEACLKSCERCGTWTYFPRPTEQQQTAIHDTAEYQEHPYFTKRRTFTPAQQRRCRYVFSQIARATDVASLRGERLLDVGCDTGMFLATAAEYAGIVPVGIDVARRSVQQAREAGIEAYCTTIEGASESMTGLRVITAIDLIEHVSDPRAFLGEIFCRLRPGGVAYLETPNIRSLVYTSGRWLSKVGAAGLVERVFPAQHIQYFTATAFADLARRCGFEITWLGTRILPWNDIGASFAARVGMGGLQTLDQCTGNRILLCAVLRRPN